ncbi:MAG TPA: glutamine--fructose-6-phosphate transaminase (isomerizing) [Solirubrobacteraceae bacterium]|jgi:glucosamine--fructose-6-phosphate aminotransferase (isomerizing)|nr:glutamine--fructose-6-phosphate transaminase (isomerizing) [Solirubrobacteraceae bacterium]
MCGIVGYVGPRRVRPILLAGLEKLEYRGYDSAGISVVENGRIDAVRAVGNLDALRSAMGDRTADAGQAVAVAVAERPHPETGIGHTRWATHGRVTEENAHPHFDTTDSVHIVVNGIVENYIALKARLIEEGASFTSETDAEVIAHLVAHLYDGDLAEAVRAAYAELRGHYAFVAMTAREPGVLVGARRECPLIIGRGEGEQFIASAIPAFLRHTRQVQYMGDDEIVVLRTDGVQFFTPAGEPVEREVVEIDWDADTAEKQGYETFMLKEIHEQADAVAETIGERAASGWGIDLGDLGPIDDEFLRQVRRIVVVACGTAHHAGLIGRYAIERWARVPVECEVASEYRYRDPVVGPGDLVIGISQSGETLDTIVAMRTARERGARVLAVTNVMGAQATREADGVLYTRAGLEIGVAATKTFVSQITAMYLIALRLAEVREVMNRAELKPIISELKRLPRLIAALLERDVSGIEAIAEAHYQDAFFLYLGRHVGLPVALEGALKLKEISYIATDAYPAGEMKHGPIALLDRDTPVVVVANESPVRDKVISNMQEVRVRGARVIAVASEGDETIGEHADEVISIPRTDWMLAPLLAVIPLQLLAYHIARWRGLNVDQPRNLAKTVTVE